MPRKTRTAGLFRALGREEERRQLRELLVVEAELRHYVVAELRRVADVLHEELLVAPLRPFGAEIGRTLVRAPGAEVRVAGGAAGAGEDLRAGDRFRIVREALPLGPGRDRLNDLARERLLRGCPFVRQDAHREHDEDCADDGDLSPFERAEIVVF